MDEKMKKEKGGEYAKRRYFTDCFNVDHDLLRFFCFKEFFGEIVEDVFLRSLKKRIKIILGIGIHEKCQPSPLQSSRCRLINKCIDINLIAELSVQYSILEAGTDRY